MRLKVPLELVGFGERCQAGLNSKTTTRSIQWFMAKEFALSGCAFARIRFFLDGSVPLEPVWRKWSEAVGTGADHDRRKVDGQVDPRRMGQ